VAQSWRIGARGRPRSQCNYTIAELIRGGVTTFAELGAQVAVQDALLEQVKRFGSRAYLSPGYDSGHWVGDELGRLERIDEQRGISGFKIATDWIKKHDGALNGRVRGILVPGACKPRRSTCSRRRSRSPTRPVCQLQRMLPFSIIEFMRSVAQ